MAGERRPAASSASPSSPPPAGSPRSPASFLFLRREASSRVGSFVVPPPPPGRSAEKPSLAAGLFPSMPHGAAGMIIGVHRPVGFDCAAVADGDDNGGGGADSFWVQRKRLRPSASLCSLNTNCVDVPEAWPNVASGEVSLCGGALEERPRWSDEAESAAGRVGNPLAAEEELIELPRKKGLVQQGGNNVGLRRSPRLSKVGDNAEGLPSAVSSPRPLPPLGDQESDKSVVSEDLVVVTFEGDKLVGFVDLRRSPRLAKAADNGEGPGVVSPPQPLPPFRVRKSTKSVVSKDLVAVTCEGDELKSGTMESPMCLGKAEPLESLGNCMPGGEQVKDCLLEVRSTKDPGNVAPRRSPGLTKLTAHSGACGLTAPPELAASTGNLKFDTFSLNCSCCQENSVGCELVGSSACSNKAESPKSLLKLGFSNSGLLNFCCKARMREGLDSAHQKQSFQFPDLAHQGKERDLSVVLALPHFSVAPRTPKSCTVKLSKHCDSGVSPADSLRPPAVESVISLGKLGSNESSRTQEPGYVEMMKCSDVGGVAKKSINVPPRRSPRLVKDNTHGTVCDSSKLSILTEITGSLEDSNNECQGQFLQLTEDSDCNSGCELSTKLDTPLSITKTKAIQAPKNPTQRRISGEGPQDTVCICTEEGLSVASSTIKDSGKKKGNQCNEIVTRKKVKETLRLFQAICRKLLRDEESKARQPCHNNRVDILALNLIKEKGKCLNIGEHCFGSIPGVEIGDEFHYRAELSIIGLHRNILAGVNYAKYDGIYVASSIVFYESYSDFMNRSDVLLYSGSAGNPNYYYRSKNGKHHGDQKLERGNLALKNNIDSKIPIRVVLALNQPKATDFQISKVKGVLTYVYDGLYLVEKYWPEIGSRGFSIFKFQLRRIPGQRQLAIREIQNSKGFKVHRGLCVEDVSQGKEKIHVPVVNTIDDQHPLPFRYINRIIYPSWHKLTPPDGCGCTDGCSDSVNCACAVKNGGEIPFNYDGAIVEAKPLVYECGPSCKCPPSCHNRVSQHGMKYPLEVFKTKSMGWGVRSLASIPSGSFICEYTGEMIEESEANRRTNDVYLFDIGQNYYDKSLWEGLSTCIPGLQQDASGAVVEDECFTIDAANCGNIGRFINHSCTPNLYAQNVLYDHDDKRMPHIMFFAAENIAPLEELTYHYNYTIDQVRDSDGNIKKKNCYCGSVECTGRLY